MKTPLNRIAIATSVLFSAFSASVMANPTAADMQQNETNVYFTGELVESACGLSPDSVDQTVELGQQPTHLFKEKGDHSTPVPFQIKLIDCDTTTAKKATFTFLSNPDKTGLLFNVTGGARGVGVRIFHNGEKIDNGSVAAENKLTDGTNIVSFSAAYERNVDSSGTVPVTAGVAKSWALLRVGYL
ncbi:fimbrial protein [Vibrio azureus]|uniref:Putative fimbrial protein n=1 Tax=Vibrio azureus NBRC 104587 TaxID=1219077 RepID=U3CI36_9VIBR|nr:fimbrial protein [Vibrio azureus]GAD77913.1 putative fimbrial protein [Vibrio azureus NBRC 104587]